MNRLPILLALTGAHRPFVCFPVRCGLLVPGCGHQDGRHRKDVDLPERIVVHGRDRASGVVRLGREGAVVATVREHADDQQQFDVRRELPQARLLEPAHIRDEVRRRERLRVGAAEIRTEHGATDARGERGEPDQPGLPMPRYRDVLHRGTHSGELVDRRAHDGRDR